MPLSTADLAQNFLKLNSLYTNPQLNNAAYMTGDKQKRKYTKKRKQIFKIIIVKRNSEGKLVEREIEPPILKKLQREGIQSNNATAS